MKSMVLPKVNVLLIQFSLLLPLVSCGQEDLATKADQLVSQLCQKDKFSGTVLIAKGEEVLFESVCGEASKRFHVANTIDTKFNLGSMNKMFTSISILQLVENGKLKLEDPISKYIDESWLPSETTDKITIHHLLSHTSGLGSYFNSTYWNTSREQFQKVEDYKPLINGDRPSFEPGDRFRYSNTGMLLLGVIIEQVTNQDYYEYIRQNIYQPAGMTNSDCYEMDQPVENLAIGYAPSKDNKYGWENNLYKHVLKGGPAGGGFSTVRDLHKFSLALRNEELVSKSSLDLLWKNHTSKYGYGFSIKSTSAGKVVGHGGGFPGINSNLDIFLENDYIVIVMSNYSSAASPIARELRGYIEKL